MNTRESDIKQWIDDAAYLVEELEALKKVVESVPFDERPVQQQESMLDMIRKIGYMQEHRYIPILMNTPDHTADDKSLKKIPGLSEADGLLNFKKGESTVQVLDEIAFKRRELVSSLRNCPERSFSEIVAVPEGEKKRSDIIREMVFFDRNQFKKVTEKVLTLDIENHSGKIHSTN